jgi:hypothetical protein
MWCQFVLLIRCIVNTLIVLKLEITSALQMDLGVGAFVLANSLVSRQARNIAAV